MKYKVLASAGFLVFSVFMCLQFNDADQYGNLDSWSWIALYGLTAIFSLLVVFKKLDERILIFWSGVGLGSLFFRLQDDIGIFHFERLAPWNFWDKTGTQMLQASNECGGLVILTSWAMCLYYISQKLKVSR